MTALTHAREAVTTVSARIGIPLIAAAVLGAGAGLALSAPTTLDLVTTTRSSTTTFTVTDDVAQNGKKVGTDHIVCRTVSQTAATCRVTLTLAKGTLLGTFMESQDANSGPVKVVGGTGAYKGATGTGTYKSLNKAGTKTAVTLRLS